MYCLIILLLRPLFMAWFPVQAWLLSRCIAMLLAAQVRRRGSSLRRFRRCRSRTHAPAHTLPAAPEPRYGRAKPDWICREVIRLAARLGSCRRVADAFNAIHRGRARVSKTWVNDYCRAHPNEIAQARRAMRRRKPYAVPVRRRWSLDLTSVRLSGGEQQTIFGLIDQGSRAVLRLQVIAHKCTWTLLANLCLAIAECGRPQAIRTDNEGMFASRLWAWAFKFADIRHERIAPKCPWLNGRVERFFGTLKGVLRQLTLPSTVALQSALDEFTGFYIHVRAHQGLQGLTPRKPGAVSASSICSTPSPAAAGYKPSTACSWVTKPDVEGLRQDFITARYRLSACELG